MLIGFGLILLALSLIAAASEPLRGSEVTALVLERLGHDPLLALIVAALLTWVMHSSVAFVLFVISLSGAGLVGLPLALTLVLGANVGGGLIALGLAPNAPVPARRVLYGNLAFRAAGALVAFLALGPITGLMAAPGRRRRAAGGGLPHALQPRARPRLPAAGGARGAAARAALPRAAGRARGGKARPPRPGAPRPAGAGAERGDPGDAAGSPTRSS